MPALIRKHTDLFDVLTVYLFMYLQFPAETV